MTSTIVKIAGASIKTTVALENSDDIDHVVKAFLSNDMNKKKIIGLDTERVQGPGAMSRIALLQLCDGENCLIVPLLTYYDCYCLPNSLVNFLNLPYFTFVGIGINKTLMKLETEYGLTCKNAVEIGSSTWSLNDHMSVLTYSEIRKFMNIEKPTSPIFDCWGKPGHMSVVLNENQVKFAAANAYSAFRIGNVSFSSFDS